MTDKFLETGTKTTVAYSVEARHPGQPFHLLEDQIFDGEWRTVRYDTGPMGVPTGFREGDEAQKRRLMTYPAAQALRWWLHAAALHSLLETRLVPHVVETAYSIKKEEPVEEICLMNLLKMDHLRHFREKKETVE